MRNKIVIIVLAAIIVVGAGVFVGLFATGKMVWANPSAKVVDSYKAVCDSKVVDEYNQAMIFTQRDGASAPSLDEKAIDALPGTIKRSADYQNDPTCQTILFWIAIHDENYEAAKSAYEAVKGLYEKRLFADSNITGNQAISSYEGAVYGLSPEAKDTEAKGDS